MLSGQMGLEPAEETTAQGAAAPADRPGCFVPQADIQIQPAQVSGGRSVKLLKTLLTSACERDCFYCPFRARRNFRRATFRPQDFANTFQDLYRRGIADGLFLSSGIAGGGARTQDRLLDTAEILRSRMNYRGYLHLKIMPGAEKEQVMRTMQLADRVSVNLEAPNTDRLARLAPHKQFLDELLQPLKWVEEIRASQSPRSAWNGRWPSSVTQFVVGAVGESDLEILTTTAWLNKSAGLRRAYFSAFSPVADTPLENQPATDPLRQHRLYQASYLLRDYGFELEELPFAASGLLPIPVDPKLAWARQHMQDARLEINKAGKQELIRVPGIGLTGAEAILRARRIHKISSAASLRKLGVLVAKAAPFILLDGKRADPQLPLFDVSMA
jgi:predicted DNA-binding helix-hairpin-helix protein